MHRRPTTPSRVLGLGALLGVIGCASPGEGGSGDSGASDTVESSTGSAAGDASDHAADEGSGPNPDEDDSLTTGAGDGPVDPSDDGSSGTEGDTGLPPSCGGAVPPLGVQTGLGLEVDGVMRQYDLFIPSSYDPNQPAPLVLNFHGLLGSPGQQSGLSQFNLAAQPYGIVVAYPAGVGASFNGGTCCGTASSTGVDDVGFARALVAALSAQLCIDESRVYATGMSNGGHMAHLLACEAADVFAAVASVTGVLTVSPGNCTPSRPIAVMDFHGDADPIVPFGGTGIGFPAVPTMMADWAARNGCGGASTVTFDRGDMRCESWPQCDDGVDVSLCVTAGGGHCWPGAGSCSFGHVSTALSASESIVTMFLSQSL